MFERRSSTAERSTEASKKVGEVLHELKEGTLKSGSGEKVTDRKQAIAIGLSEARAEGDAVKPAPPGTAPAEKANGKARDEDVARRPSPAPQAMVKRPAVGAASGKKPEAAKAVAGKSLAKKATARKPAPKAASRAD